MPSHADTFVKGGYRNWKKALGTKQKDKMQKQKQTGFPAYEQSDIHKEAVTRYVVAPSKAYGDIIDMTSTVYAAEGQVNRKMLIKILSNISYLARQSQAYRGSWDEEDDAEVNSNFYHLLMLRAEEDLEVLEWVQTKQYIYPRIQNEMIEALGLGVLREISSNIRDAHHGLLIEYGPICHIVKLPIGMIRPFWLVNNSHFTLYPQLEIIWKVSKSYVI